MNGAQYILVVDDEPDLRKLVSDFLTRNGYHVFEAHDGVAMMESLKSSQIGSGDPRTSRCLANTASAFAGGCVWRVRRAASIGNPRSNSSAGNDGATRKATTAWRGLSCLLTN
jgi:CheY-like chemotaxis protein